MPNAATNNTMKHMLTVLSLLLLSFTVVTEEIPVDGIGVKGPLEFNNTRFTLAWTDRPHSKYYIQEYLPDGESVESFTQMLSIHVFDADITVQEAVAQKVAELTERKITDPTCRYEVHETSDSKEMIVDFLLGESMDDIMTITEFNVYRFKEIAISRKKKGIMVYAYSKRAYGEDIRPFMKALKADRMTYLDQMNSTEVPAVKIPK